MGVALSIIGIVVLMALALISLSKQRQAKRAQTEKSDLRHTPEAAAQREQSMQRRAAVRAAHAERTGVGAQAEASDTDA